MKSTPSHRRFAAGLLAALCLLGFSTAATAADDLQGSWKLVILAYGADEFAIVDIHNEGGQAKGTLVDAQKGILGEDTKLESVKVEGDKAEIDLKSQRGSLRFDGTLAKDGPKAGQVLGSVQFAGGVYPARLEKTTAEKVEAGQQNPMITDFLKAARETDAKTKVAKLKELLEKHVGEPANQIIYSELLGAAEKGEMAAADVEKLVGTWLDEAKAHGKEWSDEVRVKALKALATSKPFAAAALKLAQEADKDLPADASAETKASVVGLLAVAAENAGKADIEADAKNRLAKLDAELDAEYHEKVPPFKPAAYEGRKNKEANQPVVFELFTGAQCPPCVAADVAFDALLKTYGPTDFIGLQYHLHIPGPDPLTNADSIARQKYYGDQVRGTPSTFFNGKADAGGGGGMGNSEAKYQQYRSIIDEQLERAGKANVTLSAKQLGDEIGIAAEAKADQPKDSELKLRLALTEESIRYVGGNKLRFHHHVVRALPGGADGKALADGKASVEVKLNLADVKKELEAYLDEFAKNRSFPNPVPEIALKDLSIVAFIQDDADKSIVAAVAVPVQEATP